MSKHANMGRTSAPTSSRKEIRGSNSTYRASVQANHEKSETKEQEVGEGGSKGNFDEVKGGIGSGHYKANK